MYGNVLQLECLGDIINHIHKICSGYRFPLSLSHCPDSARTEGANERVVLCLMNELVADHERVL